MVAHDSAHDVVELTRLFGLRGRPRVQFTVVDTKVAAVFHTRVKNQRGLPLAFPSFHHALLNEVIELLGRGGCVLIVGCVPSRQVG